MSKQEKFKSGLADRLKHFRMLTNLQQSELAEKLGIVQQQLSKYENEYSEPSTKFFVKLCEKTDINIHWLLTGEGEMLSSQSINTAPIEGTYFIPYWDGCPNCSDKLRKPNINDGVCVGIETITNEWACEPQNLRLISTPGEEMDGGQYPIRNNDLLVIDISKTNMSDSGIFLITTNNGEVVALRRLMELIDGTVAFYVENEKYAFAINKTYTREELDAMDFKVIGRVVKNVTYTL